MTSSSGWFRSNLIYDTLKSPPEKGSHLEAMCAYVFTHRQQSEFLKHKLIAQALINSDNSEPVQKTLDLLFSEMFPHEKGEEKSRAKEALEFLERQLAKGPEKVTPLNT